MLGGGLLAIIVVCTIMSILGFIAANKERKMRLNKNIQNK